MYLTLLSNIPYVLKYIQSIIYLRNSIYEYEIILRSGVRLHNAYDAHTHINLYSKTYSDKRIKSHWHCPNYQEI